MSDLLQAPRDKLVCILNCCRVINNLLHVGHDGDARGVHTIATVQPCLASIRLSVCLEAPMPL